MSSLQEFMDRCPWMAKLCQEHARKARDAVFAREFKAAGYVCHKGERVEASIAEMFNPVLYPWTGSGIELSQEELGYLAGVARQHVNKALRLLEKRGLIKVEYGRINLLDREALIRFASEETK